MAIITATFDTQQKTLVVSIDDAPIDNVQDFQVSRPDANGDYRCWLTSVGQEKDGLRTVTQVMARDSRDGKEATAVGSAVESEHPDFVVGVGRNAQVEAAVANYFRGR